MAESSAERPTSGNPCHSNETLTNHKTHWTARKWARKPKGALIKASVQNSNADTKVAPLQTDSRRHKQKKKNKNLLSFLYLLVKHTSPRKRNAETFKVLKILQIMLNWFFKVFLSEERIAQHFLQYKKQNKTVLTETKNMKTINLKPPVIHSTQSKQPHPF